MNTDAVYNNSNNDQQLHPRNNLVNSRVIRTHRP